MNIIDYLNSDTYTSRQQLVLLTGKCDRAVREELAEEKLKGTLIVHHPIKGGYKLTSTEYEYNFKLKNDSSRMVSLARIFCRMYGHYQFKTLWNSINDIVNMEESER